MNMSEPPTEETSPKDHVICLDQFLRVCKLVGTGGQAKVLIQAGEVKLNGETETRRRKKLQATDVVEFQGKSYRVADHVKDA